MGVKGRLMGPVSLSGSGLILAVVSKGWSGLAGTVAVFDQRKRVYQD
jgi:hypothetical protein